MSELLSKTKRFSTRGIHQNHVIVLSLSLVSICALRSPASPLDTGSAVNTWSTFPHIWSHFTKWHHLLNCSGQKQGLLPAPCQGQPIPPHKPSFLPWCRLSSPLPSTMTTGCPSPDQEPSFQSDFHTSCQNHPPVKLICGLGRCL